MPRMLPGHQGRRLTQESQDVYLDERRGYDDGWSDKRVATDLGIPLAWVTRLRAENFGPKNYNSEAEAVVASAKAVIGRIDRDSKDINNALALVTDMVNQFNTKMRDVIDRAERSIKRIEDQF